MLLKLLYRLAGPQACTLAVLPCNMPLYVLQSVKLVAGKYISNAKQ
jgi:hypothetical protein